MPAEESVSVEQVLVSPFAALAARTRVLRAAAVRPAADRAAGAVVGADPVVPVQQRRRALCCHDGSGVPGTGPGRLVAR
ncbi:hypothetical protein [Cellulomonas massiliensis]|uniref:hypothetical protein n=1 Tax=Cellulomonas massiliensis TaxID=1465811 RepID=UPI0003608D45|nr:hypothetical protein [Cellulomonas massiliensis]